MAGSQLCEPGPGLAQARPGMPDVGIQKHAKSKQQIAASIQTQEAQNQKLYAQGESQLQQQRLQLEQSAIAADERAWQAAEEREVFDINRLQAEADFLRNQQQAYNDAATAALMGGLSGSAQVGAAFQHAALQLRAQHLRRDHRDHGLRRGPAR